MRKIFQKSISFRPTKELLAKWFILMVKCVISLTAPLLYSVALVSFWYYKMYLMDIHLEEKAENMITTGIMAITGFIFTILAGGAFSTSKEKFIAMYRAAKEGDVHTLLLLRHIHQSPLEHALIAIFSFFLQGTAMAINYSSATVGIFIVGGISYVLCLFFLVVLEMDYPLSGFWFIRETPAIAKMHTIDARAYVAYQCEQNVLTFEAGMSEKLKKACMKNHKAAVAA